MSRKTKVLLGILLVLAIVCAYGCLIYPHPSNVSTGASLETPSFSHFLGTDDLGVDIFAQISRGFFNSVFIAVVSSGISFVLGGTVGIVSGYFGGVCDDVLSFVINIFLSVPQIPIMIVIGAFFGQSIFNIIAIVSLFSWARIAKIIRAKTVAIKNSDYVKIATSYGGGFFYILFTHMKADILPLLLINSINVMGRAIIQEASLAYLGLSDPTSKSWGLMINKAMGFKGIYFTNYWTWWLLPPLTVLVLTIVCIRLMVKEYEKSYFGEKR